MKYARLENETMGTKEFPKVLQVDFSTDQKGNDLKKGYYIYNSNSQTFKKTTKPKATGIREIKECDWVYQCVVNHDKTFLVLLRNHMTEYQEPLIELTKNGVSARFKTTDELEEEITKKEIKEKEKQEKQEQKEKDFYEAKRKGFSNPVELMKLHTLINESALPFSFKVEMEYNGVYKQCKSKEFYLFNTDFLSLTKITKQQAIHDIVLEQNEYAVYLYLRGKDVHVIVLRDKEQSYETFHADYDFGEITLRYQKKQLLQ